MSSIWLWFKMIFVNNVGSLIKILLINSSTIVAKELLDKENHKKAYEFVKELNARTDLNNQEKADLFNDKMLSWAKQVGKKISSSVINCLRELAVNAIKSETIK